MSTEYGSTAPRPLTYPLELREGGNVESISANMTLSQRSAQIQTLTPTGAARDVTLPAATKNGARPFWFRVAPVAEYALSVKKPDGSKLATLYPGESCLVASSEGDWYAMNEPQGPIEIADPGDAGAIPIDRAGVVHLVTGGAETRTVADPEQVGLLLSLFFLTDGGNCVVTFASPINQAGNTIATFNDATDSVHVRSVRDGASSYRWAIVGNDGAALS